MKNNNTPKLLKITFWSLSTIFFFANTIVLGNLLHKLTQGSISKHTSEFYVSHIFQEYINSDPGLKTGDQIVSVQGQKVSTENTYNNIIRALGDASSVELLIIRNGQEQHVTVEDIGNDSVNGPLIGIQTTNFVGKKASQPEIVEHHLANLLTENDYILGSKKYSTQKSPSTTSIFFRRFIFLTLTLISLFMLIKTAKPKHENT